MTDQESRSGGGGHARLAIIAAALVVVLGSSGVAWFAYNKGFYRASDQLAPLVQAESGATKRRPEQPGGLEIPHQDKLVFERLAPGASGPRVERLLPPPEEPLAKPQPPVIEVAEQVEETEAPPAIAGTIVDALANRTPEPPVVPEQIAKAPPKVEAPTTESLLAEAPPPPPVPQTQAAETAAKPKTESLLAAPTPPPAPEPQIAVVPAPEPPQVAAKPDPAPEIKPAASPSVAWRIQLASLSSDKGAKTEWQRIKGRNQELLQNLQLNVQEAKLPRGTFYRIQAGPLADKAAAQRLCTSLKERKQDCLVVKP
ncbi:MAG: SPOR domain-containing protein [Alphaproteobacteria bacterium]